MKKCFYLSLFLLTPINIISMGPLIINGCNINDCTKPGYIFSYTFESTNNIALNLNDNKLEIGRTEVKNIRALEEEYVTLKNIPQIKNLNFEIKSSLSAEKAYCNTDENLLFSASNLKLSNIILESKEIFFGFDRLDVDKCFIDADTLQIKSFNRQSMIKLIRFTFNKNLPVPKCVQGKLDFITNETNGIFFVLGAQKVDILFANKAFK